MVACLKTTKCNGVYHIETLKIWRIIANKSGEKNGNPSKPVKVMLRDMELMAARSFYWKVFADFNIGRSYRNFDSLDHAFRQCTIDRKCNGVSSQVDARPSLYIFLLLIYS